MGVGGEEITGVVTLSRAGLPHPSKRCCWFQTLLLVQFSAIWNQQHCLEGCGSPAR